MLRQDMSLKTMVDLDMTDEDMAMLDLDVVVYIKGAIVSIAKQINHDFIRYLFTSDKKDELLAMFKDIQKTIFYDFEYKGDRNITIFELYSKRPYTETESLLNDLLVSYDHRAEVLFDIYTHDSHKYRLSNLDGIVKNDKLH